MDRVLEQLHSVPRFDYQFKSATNVFNVDWQSDAGKSYIGGVLMQAGGIFALAILCLLAFGIALMVGCACRKKHVASPRGAGLRRLCGQRTSYLALSALLAALLVAVCVLVRTKFTSGVNSTLDGLRAFDNVLATTATSVNGPLTASLAGAASAATQLKNAASGVPQIAAAADALSTGAASARSAASTLGSALSDADSALQGKLLGRSASFDLSDYDGHISVGAWALLGVVLGWLGLSLLTLPATKCTALLFKIMAGVLLLAGVVTIALAGIFYAAALVAADVCVAPGTSVSTALAAAGSAIDPVVSSTISYYTACGANPALAPAGAYSDALVSAAKLADGLRNVTQLNATIYANNLQASYGALVADVAGNFSIANATMVGIVGGISCAPMNSIWNQLAGALCGTDATNPSIATGVVVSFCILAAAAALMVLLLINATHLCFRHPGDALPAPEAGDLDANVTVRSSKKHKDVEDWHGAAAPVAGAAPKAAPAGAAASYQY